MDNLDANNPIKEYTGVWIPAEVMESEELEPLDKLVYGEIASFRECYASNAWLAKRIKRSEQTASRCVQKLIKLGFVENCGFNGRFRIVRVVKYDKAASSNLTRQTSQICITENKVKNKVYISNKLDSGEPQNEVVENSEKKEYGNHEVNAILELWEHETGLIANVAKANRLAAYNLIRRRGFDGACEVVRLCGRAIKSGDQYAPRVASFRDLQGQFEKLSKLEAWEARQKPVKQGISLDFYSRDSYDEPELSDEEFEANREKNREAIREAREKLAFLKKGGSR
jgi:DNA-binding Lrp family transcriptional regulator